MASHSKPKSFSCEFCGKCLKIRRSLQRHIYTHTGEKPYKCKVRGKFFKGPSDLNVHTRIHFDRKIYKCEICDRNFQEKCHLVHHKLIHTGLKPHQCHVCGACFAWLDALKGHQKTVKCHSKLKPQSECVWFVNGSLRQTSIIAPWQLSS